MDQPTTNELAFARRYAAMIEVAILRRNFDAARAAIADAEMKMLSSPSTVVTIADLGLPAKLEMALDRLGVMYIHKVKGRSIRHLSELPGVGPGWAHRLFTAVRQSASSCNKGRNA